ncbi:DoxX family protein [Persicobacter diffluens]|uniref:DoxX family protein n=1 Tax=Persicobacter diffluens TaxID=981 RepID=A0AAN4W1V4_9BACT|nr:hypothetical protein PEDI_33290 [Persicobacter diffluens]
MTAKTNRIIYLIATGLLSLMMLGSAGMYIFNHEEMSKVFESLAYPTYIIYPLAAAKILGLVAIWTKKSQTLKEWAYAGFFFDFVLAFMAHTAVGDGEAAPSAVATLILLVSYYFEDKF